MSFAAVKTNLIESELLKRLWEDCLNMVRGFDVPLISANLARSSSDLELSLYEPVSVLATEISPASGILDQLVDRHADYIYSYAFKYFRSAEKAEELVQETFLAATQSIQSFKEQSSARTWLIGILKFKIIDKLRAKQRADKVDFVESNQENFDNLFDAVDHWRDESGPLSWGDSAEKVIHQKQFVSILESCLSKLPERVRQIFLLRELEGQSREEICQELEVTSSNVGVILYRARVYLQQCLQLNWLSSDKGRDSK